MNSLTTLQPTRGKRLWGAAMALAVGGLSATIAKAEYFVDFEDATKVSYGSGTVTLNGLDWNLTEALIGNAAADFKIDLQSARLRGYATSSMTMLADKANGAGTISFSHRRYGTDPQEPWAVEYSSTAGGSWTQVGGDFTAGADVVIFSESVNVGGPIRFRIINKGAATVNRRTNIDNILITDFSGSDEIPPMVQTLSPANEATDVALDAALTITFNEPIAARTGSVTLRALADGTLVETFAVPGAAVEIIGSSATIQPTALLTAGSGYYLEISAGAFEDLAENPFAGFSGSGTWSFSTVGPDTVGPQPVAFTPGSGATNVDPAIPFIGAEFDEEAYPGTGLIVIRNVDTLAVAASFDVENDFEVLVFGNLISITLSAPLPLNSTFRVEIPAGALVDALGNPSPAFGEDGAWSFSTPTAASLPDGVPYTQDFAEFVSAATLPTGWSLTADGTANNRFDHSMWFTETAPNTGTGIKHSAADPVVNVFGYQHTGNTGVVQQILTLVNDTGAAITDLTVTYRGRVSRESVGRDPFYAVTVAGELAEGLAYSTNQGDNVLTRASVGGLSIGEGEIFTVVWTSDGSGTGSPGSGSRKQIGISEISVSVGSAVFEPSVAGITFDYATLTQTSLEVTSSVTDDGGGTILERGFVFSPHATNSSPEIDGPGVTQVTDIDAITGPLTAELLGLSATTQYSVRSYAKNSEGTTYSSPVTFFTLLPPPALGTTYLQPFNNFSGTIVDGTLPAGWKAVSSGGINSFGGTWATGTAGGLRGNVSSPGVLGYQHVNPSGVLTVSLSLVNDSGATLEELYVSYLGRVERPTQSRSPEWTVSLNGTVISELAYSTAVGTDEAKSALITGLSIPDGAVFTLTWVSDGDVGDGGARRQIGISNVRVSTEEFVGGDFASWAIANGIGGELPGGDFDGDGISNFMEYALGLNPTVPSGAPGSFVDGVLSFAKGEDAVANGDVLYFIETSSTLAADSWTTVTPTTDTPTEISYVLPTGQDRIFTRLVATAAP